MNAHDLFGLRSDWREVTVERRRAMFTEGEIGRFCLVSGNRVPLLHHFTLDVIPLRWLRRDAEREARHVSKVAAGAKRYFRASAAAWFRRKSGGAEKAGAR